MVFTFQLLVSFTASTASMYSVFAGIYFATQCQQRDRERGGNGERKVDAQCNYRLTGMEMRETETKVGEGLQQIRTLKPKSLFTQD